MQQNNRTSICNYLQHFKHLSLKLEAVSLLGRQLKRRGKEEEEAAAAAATMMSTSSATTRAWIS